MTERLKSKIDIMRIRYRLRNFWQTLRDIDYIEHIITGVVIGGVIGGLIFSMVSPFLVPPVQDAIVDSGYGPSPQPEFRLMYENETNYERIQNSTNVSINSSQYQVFYGVIRNPTNKLMTEVNLLYLFSGCEESEGTFLTSLDSAVSTRSSDDVEVREFYEGCGTEVTIEELPPQKWVTFYAVVDMSETNNQIERDLERQQVANLGHYEWQYNGRMYFAEIDTVVSVTDELEQGDKLN